MKVLTLMMVLVSGVVVSSAEAKTCPGGGNGGCVGMTACCVSSGCTTDTCCCKGKCKKQGCQSPTCQCATTAGSTTGGSTGSGATQTPPSGRRGRSGR